MAHWNSYCYYNRCNLKPSEIFYSQDSIASRFRDGRSVQEAAIRVIQRKLDVEDFPTIEVVKRSDGKYYSLDNRRLYVFRVGQYNGIVAKVPVTIVPEQWYHLRKFTSRNGGTEIRVRRERTYANWKSSWNKPEVHGTVAAVAVRQQSIARSQLFGTNQFKEANIQAVRTRPLQTDTDIRTSSRQVGYVATAARYSSPQKKKEPDISSAFATLTLTPTQGPRMKSCLSTILSSVLLPERMLSAPLQVARITQFVIGRKQLILEALLEHQWKSKERSIYGVFDGICTNIITTT